MKRYLYIITALAFLTALASCKEEEGDLFDTEVSGIYFNYEGTSDSPLHGSCNFAPYYIQDSTVLTMHIDIATLGYVSESDRTAIIRSKKIDDDDYPLAEADYSERITIPAGATSYRLDVTLHRPELQSQSGVVLYFDTEDPESDFGEGIAGRNEYEIIVQNLFEQPADWSAAEPYYGEYSVEKHLFLLRTLGRSDITSSTRMGAYNLQVVLAVREQAAADPTAEVMAIPFFARDPYDYQNPVASYGKPYYWDDYDLSDWVGDWFPEGDYNNLDLNFVRFANAMGLTTANERAFFADKENAHKEVIKYMMEVYNDCFARLQNDPYNEWSTTYTFTFSCAPLRSGVEYDVVRPAQWEGACAELLRPYYGEYSEEKYRFMLQLCAEQNLPPARYLPYLFAVSPGHYGEDGWIWEPSYVSFTRDEWGPNPEEYSGEDDLREYNARFRAAAVEAGHPDWFPEVE